jgi:uncharacterized membrane protein
VTAQEEPRMHKIEQFVVVDRPVSMVYNQWTQFEKFPEFMSGGEEVRQVQEQDRRISWKAVNGVHNAGTVRFKPLGKDRTEVHLQLVYEANGALEGAGYALGRIAKRVKASLLEFRDFAAR